MENLFEKGMINLAHAAVTEGVNGPGRRFTVWAQGCPRHCGGCFNPDLIPFVEKTLVSPLALAARALSSEIDGITLSGGEPFDQAGVLSEFIRAVKTARPAMTAIAFTGYEIEELQKNGGEAPKLLDALDLLIDGPYEEKNPCRDNLRGSKNQRIIPLTPEGEALALKISSSGTPEVEISISKEGDVIISGFPSPELAFALRKKLSPGG